MRLVEACLSLLPFVSLRAGWATHLPALRTSCCAPSPFTSVVVSLVVRSSQSWMSGTCCSLGAIAVSHKDVRTRGLPAVTPGSFGTAHVLEHRQDCLQSRTTDSLPRQTPGVLLWLNCSWVHSNEQQDRTRFSHPPSTITIQHYSVLLGNPPAPLPAKPRMNNCKTSTI